MLELIGRPLYYSKFDRTLHKSPLKVFVTKFFSPLNVTFFALAFMLAYAGLPVGIITSDITLDTSSPFCQQQHKFAGASSHYKFSVVATKTNEKKANNKKVLPPLIITNRQLLPSKIAKAANHTVWDLANTKFISIRGEEIGLSSDVDSILAGSMAELAPYSFGIYSQNYLLNSIHAQAPAAFFVFS